MRSSFGLLIPLLCACTDSFTAEDAIVVAYQLHGAGGVEGAERVLAGKETACDLGGTIAAHGDVTRSGDSSYSVATMMISNDCALDSASGRMMFSTPEPLTQEATAVLNDSRRLAGASEHITGTFDWSLPDGDGTCDIELAVESVYGAVLVVGRYETEVAYTGTICGFAIGWYCHTNWLLGGYCEEV